MFRFVFFLILPLFTFSQDYNYTNIDKSLLENTNAVVRLDKMEINVLATNKLNYTVNKVVTVLNEKADDNSRCRIGYDKERKIKNLEVYVYNKEGKEIEHIKKKEFDDLSAVDGFSLYTDNRLLYHRYTPVEYPYTIALKYSIETSDTAFFPQWYFLSDYLTSVEKSHLEINYASQNLKPEIKELNLADFSFNKKDNANTMLYTAENILPIKYESYSPSIREVVPRLVLKMNEFSLKGETTSAKNWKEIGSWMNEALLKNQEILPEETIIKVNKLVEGLPNDLEKAKAVYKFVQENTRYISVQIGIGGWKPISAIEVDRVKYGDCKGLSNYTYALLKAVGVTSYYTVIWAGGRKIDFDPDFSNLQGNHAILAIPYEGKYYWIDCTSQVNPFGFVGDFTDDRLALVMTPEGGEIVKTVAYLNEDNDQTTVAEYSLKEDGSIKGKVKINTGGIQYDNRFSLEDKSQDDIEKHYKNYWDNINNLKVDNIKFFNDMDNVIFKENVSITANDYASKSGERMLFEINAFNKNTLVPNRYRNRKMPLVIQRGYLDKDEFKIQLPKEYELEAMPKPLVLENEFGSYKTTYEFDETNKTILYYRELLIKAGNYPKEKYQSYRNFRKEIAKADNSKVVLIKPTK